MAETIKGIVVTIGGDTTGLAKALGDVNAQSRDIQSELKQVEKLLKLDPTNTELVAQKQKLLSDAIATTTQKLDTLKAAQAQVNDQFARGEISEGQYRAFQRECEATEQQLKSLQKQLDSTNKSFDLSGAVQKASQSMQSFGKQLTNTGRELTMSLSVPIIGAAGAAISFSNTFNKSMANVATLIPGATERVAELKDNVQAMAVETGKSTEDLAGGLYQVISAFGDSADSAKVLEINAKAAAAGLATTTDAINLTSAVTKGYGDTSAEAVQRVSDLAFQTVKLGQTTFPELANSIGRVTPLAAALGVSMQDMFGVMATATGVTGDANEVSTQFRGILQSLMSPAAGMADLLQQLGYKSGEAMLQQLGLQGTIAKIVSTAEESGVPLQQFIGSIEGQTLALALAGPQADTLTAKLKAMQDATGMTDEAFTEQTDGVNKTGFAMDQFQQKLAVVAQKAGDALAPALNRALDAAQPLIDAAERLAEWFTNLDPKTQTIIIGVLAFTAAIGPLLMVLGTLVTGIGALLSPIGLVVVAIGAVIAIGVALATHWTEIKAFLANTWNAIKSAAESVWNAIKAFFVAVWDGITWVFKNLTLPGILMSHWDQIKTTIENVWNGIKAWFAKWWETLLVVFGGPIGLLVLTIIKNWDKIKAATITAWNAIIQFFADVWQKIKDVFEPPIQFVINLLANAWNTISTGITSAWNSITTFFSNIWTGIKDTFTNAFTSMVDSALNFGKRIMQALKDGIGSIKLPIPSISLKWTEGPLGIQIPDLDFGVNWRALSDLVPFLAEGGLVTRPTLAMMGEAGTEAALPLSKLQPMMTQALADAIRGLSVDTGRSVPAQQAPQEAVLMVDGVKLARVLLPRLTAERQRLGIETP